MSTETRNFAGLRVASFESRNAEEMKRMLERAGAVALVSPSMREVPLDEGAAAITYAKGILAGEFDVIILLTGVGLRNLLKLVEGHIERDAFIAALSRTTLVCRGPKPVQALREIGLKPNITVPEPNTWRELLATLDAQLPVTGKRVAVQEYGLSNTRLLDGLNERQAIVTRVEIYRWALPLDTGPMEANLQALVAGQLDVLMFTSTPQVLHVVEVAERLNLSDQLPAALRRVVVASVGPSTSETLREHGWPVDLEPEHPKMGHLVNAAAARCGELLAVKRAQVEAVSSAAVSEMTGSYAERLHNSLFLRACRRESVERTPVWLMRQAGRYMPEYRAVREKVSFLELCYNPALCTEVMVTAVQRLGVDAAIIFADLLPILQPMGLDLEFQKDEGPVIHNPVRVAADLGRFRELEDVSPLHFVYETVKQTRAALPPEIPVIGFAGAPFTLASYAIEGKGSRNYIVAKQMMYRDSGLWHELLARLARSIGRYLQAQIAAGAQAVQLFDSWVGCLGPDDYRRYVLPHTRTVIEALPTGFPVIHFGAGNPALLPLLAEAGGTVLGIDWRIPLDQAWQQVGFDRAVQGNLDPVVLLGSPAEIRSQAQAVLQRAGGRAGHIFNLGHGILPQTPVDHVLGLLDVVREFRLA